MTVKLSKNFTADELACRCCGYIVPGEELRRLVDALETLRSHVGSVVIVSGYRCPSNNRAVGGAPKSKHLTMEAADLHVEGFAPAQLAAIVKQHCPTVRGIGVGRTKFHIDVRLGALSEWTYA